MDTLKGSERWARIAATADDDRVMEAILTNYKEKGWEASTGPTMQRLEEWIGGHLGDVVDFGCGLLRNSTSLAKRSKRVWGMDTPEMLERSALLLRESPDLDPEGRIILTMGPDELYFLKPDLIFVSLVAQHMHPDALQDAFDLFAKHGKKLYVTGRNWSDFADREAHPMATWDMIDKALAGRMKLVNEADDGQEHRTKLWTQP